MSLLSETAVLIAPENRLCTICARGGSKGLPGKNIRILEGIPLIAHSIMQARDCGLFSHVAVSSDSSEILEIAERFGADHLIQRPSELASDTAGKLPAIVHAVHEVEKCSGLTFTTLVDLDATSPLRLPEDIHGAVEMLEHFKLTSVITGSTARHSPYFNMVERQQDGTVRLVKDFPNQQILRRQDSPLCFDMNASIYVWSRSAFLDNPAIFYPDTHLFEMPEERSIDIDSPLDFEIVSLIFSKRTIKSKT